MAKPAAGRAGAGGTAQMEYSLRVHLPGEPQPLQLGTVGLGQSFADIKALIWKARSWDEKIRPRKNYAFRVAGGEMYFSDEDMFSSLVHVGPMFRESPPVDKNSIEVVLYAINDIADKLKRDSLLCTLSPIIMCGYLNKLGEGLMAGWSRRYFVLQDNTLFYFADEKSYNAKEKAKGYIPMPCTFVRHQNYKGQNLVFELQAKHLGKRNYFMQAESEQTLEQWRKICVLMSLRRVKTVTATICEELTTRGLSELELIFQMPGNKDVIAKLKTSFDNGDNVRLNDVTDYKAMADVIKLALKDTLQEPVLGYFLYSKWILVAQEESQRIPEIRGLLTQLPYHVHTFLDFFFGFLNKLSAGSMTNMMTAKILAVCIGPVVQRSEQETAPNAKVNDADFRGVESMIDRWSAIFGENDKKSEQLQYDAPAATPAVASPAPSASPAIASDAKDGPVNAADVPAWLKKFQLANANWEKDWRLRQKNVMSGLGELQNQIKSSGNALPSGFADMNACFVAEAEWRAESLANCDALTAKLAKLTAQISAGATN